MSYFIFLVEERFPHYPAESEILCIFPNQLDNNEQDTQSYIYRVKEERVKLIHIDGWGRGVIFERGEMEMREVG